MDKKIITCCFAIISALLIIVIIIRAAALLSVDAGNGLPWTSQIIIMIIEKGLVFPFVLSIFALIISISMLLLDGKSKK